MISSYEAATIHVSTSEKAPTAWMLPKKNHEHLNEIMEPASPDSQGDDTLSDPIWKGLNVPEM